MESNCGAERHPYSMINVGRLMFSLFGIHNSDQPRMAQKKVEAPMAELSLKKVSDLLGTQEFPGSDNELKVLCVRIRELVEMNGEDWVRQHRQKLLEEWDYIIQQKIIT